jgi:hypothetical protein
MQRTVGFQLRAFTSVAPSLSCIPSPFPAATTGRAALGWVGLTLLVQLPRKVRTEVESLLPPSFCSCYLGRM